MNKRGKKRKLLIGSASITSVVVLISVTLGPSIYFGSENSIIIENSYSENWDIIVPDDYKNIQNAVDNAKEGQRIFVRSGNYKLSEGLFSKSLTINKKGLTICGENKETTIINGIYVKTPIYINADSINFSGFTILNNDINGSLITLNSNDCKIHDNILVIKDYYDGIEYGVKTLYADENYISNNKIIKGDYGVKVILSNNNIFENNTVENCSFGIYITSIFLIDFNEKTTKTLSRSSSQGNIFINNLIINNYRGLIFYLSDSNSVLNNTIVSEQRFGLTLSRCKNNIIKNNKFIGNGIEIDGTDLNHFVHVIQDNTINGKPIYYYNKQNDFNVPSDAGQIIIVDCQKININKVKISDAPTALLIAFSSLIVIENCEISSNYQGLILFYSYYCSIIKNNFIENTFDARFVVSGFFNRKKNSWRGNYWDSRIVNKRLILGLLPKRIPGRFHLKIRFGVFDKFGLGYRTWNFDRSPSKSAYNI